jgi:hypothetical protein
LRVHGRGSFETALDGKTQARGTFSAGKRLGDETGPAKPGGVLRDTFEGAAAAMANALDKY